MWGGGGGTGGSGGGGGLDPSALAGYATMGWVEDNYVSKAFFNQLFEYQYNHRVLTKDGETVVSDVTTSMVAAPNEVVDTTSHTETDEETGYTIITTNTITGIKAKAGLWTNQYLSALGQNSGGGGGGGATLFEPLLSINESGLAAPTDAQDGMTVVWDKNTHKWKYGATGGGSGEYLPLTGGMMSGYIRWHTNSQGTDIGTSTIGAGDLDSGGNAFIGTTNRANLAIGSWNGISLWNRCDSGSYSLMTTGNFNARTGVWNVVGGYQVNGNSVATEQWVKENTVDYIGDIAADFNFADMHDLGGGVYQLHTNNTQTHKPTTYGILVDFESTNGHLQLAAGVDENLYVRSYWWTGNPEGFTYPGWKTLATKEWISQNYISIAFFNRLFQAKNGSTNVNPNDMTTTIDNIKAMFGFWTDQYLSALGQNSSGGGGGGSSTLAGLNDVSLSNPSNGQILQYNGTQWVNANAPQTGVTSVAAGTGLTTNITGGGAITSTGTISLSSATQTDIAKGVTAYGWGNHALAGYAQNSALNNYLPLAGGTMRGVITLGHSTTEGSSYSSAISVALRTTSGTRADTYTYGNWIHGGEDHADQDGANIQIGTWFGFGIYPTISGMTRTQGKNSFWHNARTGNTYTWGNFYCYDGTNNNKVATENWVNGAYLPLAGGTMTGKLRLLTGSDVGIEASDNAGLLVYKPESGWSGVSNTQWAVGALSAQGVIRSNDNSLLHYNGTNNYKIWDENNDGSGSGLDADLLDGIHAKDMLIHYQLPRNVTASTYWHKLGEYITGGDNSNLILEVYSGSGYNSTGNQNSWAKIIIKDGWQSQTSETNSVGVSVEEYGYYSTGIKVIVVATAHNMGAVWVQLPWQYAVGDYVVYGRYTSWTHNNSIDSDTTTAPTSNQNPVYYYRNLSYLNKNGQEAVTLQHDFSVKAGVDGAQLRIGNILLKYDATNKALKIEHQGTNGVEAGNIYATGAVSALGANTSGGGGGGGASTLSDLLDVALSSPSNGQVLTYDNATGKWVNAAVPTPSMAGYATEIWVDQNYLKSVSFSDLTSHPTTLSGYGITDAKIQNGTITLGSNTITPLTSVAFNDLTSHPTTLSGYGITDAKIDSGTITLGSNTITPLTSVAFNDLTTHPTTIAGYGITDAKIQNGTITLGSNSITPLTSHQTVSGTFWGQAWSNGGTVTGSLAAGSNGGAIEQFHCIELNNAGSLSGYGGYIDFHYNGSAADYTSRLIEDAVGVLSIQANNNTSPYSAKLAGLKIGADVSGESFLQIGAVRLVYDTSNNALKVIKSDGTAANFYATGGLSALGMSAGVSSIDAMTFGYLKVNDQLVFGNNQALMYKDDYLYIECSDNISVNNVEFDYNGNVYTNGSVRAARFYLDSNRYLYVSGGTLYYYNGSTSKQVAFTN